MKILFFGDVYGRLGREGLARVLPVWQREHQPDLVVANVENIAHGKGVTKNILLELESLGVGAFTSGNHVFRTGKLADECFKDFTNLIRPYNYGAGYPGLGFCTLTVKGQKISLLNLNGTTFFENQFPTSIANPFLAADEVLAGPLKDGGIILVDFHAEATSEKVAMGWFLDGRVSAVLGTHTHVPTSDQWVMPKGTAFVTDVGMCGSRNSVIGVKVENVVSRFTGSKWLPMEPAEEGPVGINAVLIEIQDTTAKNITRLYSQY
jgi:metallophosphoesterase (TIGR00282 family)